MTILFDNPDDDVLDSMETGHWRLIAVQREADADDDDTNDKSVDLSIEDAYEVLALTFQQRETDDAES